jgi:hypothetical protein
LKSHRYLSALWVARGWTGTGLKKSLAGRCLIIGPQRTEPVELVIGCGVMAPSLAPFLHDALIGGMLTAMVQTLAIQQVGDQHSVKVRWQLSIKSVR